MTKAAFDSWVEAYRRFAEEGSSMTWPSETLVRLFKGPYLECMGQDLSGRKVLDVGFGDGNNLIFLGSLGLKLFGTEVDAEICKRVRGTLNSLGYKSDLRVGTNRNLPFSDGEFDFLVSWDVVHYEDREETIREAIEEYRRVLRPGGRFFLSTTGPQHKILRDSRSLGNHRYEIGREDDFRKGQIYFYFDTSENVREYFSRGFADVLVGRTHQHMLTETLDSFIASGVKE